MCRCPSWYVRFYQIFLHDLTVLQGGFEATEKIREYESLGKRRTPIIALTAHAMVGDREKCIEAKMDDYLSKPLKQSHLVQTISKYTTTLRWSPVTYHVTTPSTSIPAIGRFHPSPQWHALSLPSASRPLKPMYLFSILRHFAASLGHILQFLEADCILE